MARRSGKAVVVVEKWMQEAGRADRPGRRRRRRGWRIVGWICLWLMFAMTAAIAGKVSAGGGPAVPPGTFATAYAGVAADSSSAANPSANRLASHRPASSRRARIEPRSRARSAPSATSAAAMPT